MSTQDKEAHDYCDECNQQLPDDLKNVLQIRVRGGYSMFCDPMDGEPWAKPTMYVALCHDCGAKMLRSSKAMQKIYGHHGMHPCDNDIRCCEWCWHNGDFGENGELLPAEQWRIPPYQLEL